jgi:hypothetical protein
LIVFSIYRKNSNWLEKKNETIPDTPEPLDGSSPQISKKKVTAQ